MVRQAVDKGVRRAVISLRRIAENARDRGEHDEAIELHFPRRFVEQPCALRLRFEHASHALGGERGEWRIVDHHREMKDAAQRLPPGFNLSEESLHIVRRADVGRHDAHLHAALLQLLQRILRPRDSMRRCGSSAQDDARRNQPTIRASTLP